MGLEKPRVSISWTSAANSRGQGKCSNVKSQESCILEKNWKGIRQNKATKVRIEDKVRDWQGFLFRVIVSTRVNYWTVLTREMQSNLSYRSLKNYCMENKLKGDSEKAS